ncbi:hypothetical protein F5Y15DRAFT_48285 [Xylariaceae sp. FL0016]|nr:hypothetical protein F5Y15DRAFT_48285 [Xylariaceae sp. FL0016]
MDHHRPPPAQPHLQSGTTHLSKPQVFVQLAFGVSWSERHAPRSHTMTYMSRNLKNVRETGNFPRQVPPPTTNFLDSTQQQPQQSQSQHRPRGRSSRHHHAHSGQSRQHHGSSRSREQGNVRRRAGDSPREHLRNQSRDSRDEARGESHERGRSAPPPINDSPWDAHATASATLFPHSSHAPRDQPQVWKALPAPPSQFRLGEDGLPWEAWSPPCDLDGAEDESPYANKPTTVPLSPPRRGEDPSRVEDLETLSMAMMTVDNGFENQWWYQGGRESTDWAWRSDDADDARPLSMDDALLLSAAEPPAASAIPGFHHDEDSSTYEPQPSLRDLVSPLSEYPSPASSYRGPLRRSLTTRSEELWIGP